MHGLQYVRKNMMFQYGLLHLTNYSVMKKYSRFPNNFLPYFLFCCWCCNVKLDVKLDVDVKLDGV